MIRTLPRSLFTGWLLWLLAIFAFQTFVSQRLDVVRPDNVTPESAELTTADSIAGRPSLSEPFLNPFVAWDAEFYVSIAITGSYDDPAINRVGDTGLSNSYAYFPLYPFLMRALGLPLIALFGLSPLVAMTLTGVLISALGSLAAVIGLYLIAIRALKFNEADAQRAAHYLMIFPTGFFMLQVYTEGLFLGLSLLSLALIYDKKPLRAGALAALAVATRGVGVALIIPLAWMTWRQIYASQVYGFVFDPVLRQNPLLAWLRANWRWVLALALPILTLLLIQTSEFGQRFQIVQMALGNETLNPIIGAKRLLAAAWRVVGPEMHEHTRMYYILVVASIVLAGISIIWSFRREPMLALYGLAVIALPLVGGPTGSFHRYILASPAVFLMLASAFRKPDHDSAWRLFSTLWLALLALMFSFDLWAG
jgi:hypothetical protein